MDHHLIETLSEIGIAFLLFIVGLELDFKKLKNIGLISSAGGLLQFTFLFGIGYFISVALQIFTTLEAVYIGIMLAFSSTMIVVKVLSDKHELNTLHGNIMVGLLLMQDLIAIISISVLATLDNFVFSSFLIKLVEGLGILAIGIFLSQTLLSKLFRFAARSQDLLFILALSVCFGFSLLYELIGFSIAIGAFIAGILIGSMPYSLDIVSKIKPLRDFFAILFFVSLGMNFIAVDVSSIIVPVIVLLMFVLVLKPIITFVLVGLFGYAKRTAFTVGITFAQISEFGLIIVTLGLNLGHISQEIFSITEILAIITITLTSYIDKYREKLYSWAKPLLRIFDLNPNNKMEFVPVSHSYKTVLCGFDRMGYSIAKSFLDDLHDFVIVDFNPEIIKNLMKKKIPCIYGDFSSEEIIERIDFEKSELVISTVPDKEANLKLLRAVKKENLNCLVFLTSDTVHDSLELYRAGADYVLIPKFLGGEYATEIIHDVKEDFRALIKLRFDHIQELKHRLTIGHNTTVPR